MNIANIVATFLILILIFYPLMKITKRSIEKGIQKAEPESLPYVVEKWLTENTPSK